MSRFFIKAGEIIPSTILRCLGIYNRKNKLYFVFLEQGRAVGRNNQRALRRAIVPDTFKQ